MGGLKLPLDWLYFSVQVAHLYRNLQDRQKDKDPMVVAYADKCRYRLRSKIAHLELKGKTPNVAATAAARELACFIWGMMTNHIA